MITTAYVLLVMTFAPTGNVYVKPTVTADAETCAALLHLHRMEGKPNVVAACVPPNAALAIEGEDKPTS